MWAATNNSLIDYKWTGTKHLSNVV